MKLNLKAVLVFLSFLLFLACGQNSKNADKAIKESKSALSKLKETGKAAKAYSGMATKAKKMADDTKRLSEMEPIDQAELKEWLPKELKNYKRTYYSSGEAAMMGITSFESRFTNTNDETKTFEMEVVDGAGSLASSLIATYSHKFTSGLEEESEHGYKETVKKNGYDGYEEQNNTDKTAKIEFIKDDRFYVKLNGKNTTADELWDVVKELPMKNLK